MVLFFAVYFPLCTSRYTIRYIKAQTFTFPSPLYLLIFYVVFIINDPGKCFIFYLQTAPCWKFSPYVCRCRTRQSTVRLSFRYLVCCCRPTLKSVILKAILSAYHVIWFWCKLLNGETVLYNSRQWNCILANLFCL